MFVEISLSPNLKYHQITVSDRWGSDRKKSCSRVAENYPGWRGNIFFLDFGTSSALQSRKGPMELACLLLLLARRASSTLVPNNLINRLKHYVLQLGDPIPTLCLPYTPQNHPHPVPYTYPIPHRTTHTLYTPLPNASPHKTFVLGGYRGLVFGGGLHLGAKQKKMHRAGIGMLLGERAMVGTWTWG